VLLRKQRMADPLSIAGSVVGITAAGVQASVKLYALAEKVATASQRVTSIADDISSTCAILNQVRELIIPQPDASGTLKSVFNTVALNDISHALRRCRSSFTDIEALLRRAFEQVGKRPALRSNIKLSRFEQAKWPFLQPQFDELRNDLRDAKGNLVLMIAVASLALAQRDGRQRPIHDTERLEFTSTIVQLQRSTIKSTQQTPADDSQRQTGRSREIPEQSVDIHSTGNMSTRHTSKAENTNSLRASSSSAQHSDDTTPLSSNSARGLPLTGTNIGLANLSLASVSDTRPEVRKPPSKTKPLAEVDDTVRVSSRSRPGGIVLSRRGITHGPSSSRASHPSDEPTPPKPPSSTPLFESTAELQRQEEHPQDITAAGNDDIDCSYQGWTTTYLQGLATGHGDSLSLDKWQLPPTSLVKLLKAYTNEGNDPYLVMSELTQEQQTMIKEKLPEDDAEIVYVRLQRDITVSSVFGRLNVETLKWVIMPKFPTAATMRGPYSRQKYRTSYAQYTEPSSVEMGPKNSESRPEIIAAQQSDPLHDPSSPARLTPPAPSTPDLSRMPSTEPSEEAGEIRRKKFKRFRLGRIGKSFTDAPEPGEESVTPELDPDFYPITDLSRVEKPTHPTITLADADDESDDEPASVVEYSSSPHPWEDSIPYYPETTQKPSQPAEDNGQDIVQELLARWTVS